MTCEFSRIGIYNSLPIKSVAKTGQASAPSEVQARPDCGRIKGVEKFQDSSANERSIYKSAKRAA